MSVLDLYRALGGRTDLPGFGPEEIDAGHRSALRLHRKHPTERSCRTCAFQEAPSSFTRCDACVTVGVTADRNQWTNPETFEQPNMPKPEPLPVEAVPEPEVAPEVPSWDPNVFLAAFPTSLGEVAALKAADAAENDRLLELQREYAEAVHALNMANGYAPSRSMVQTAPLPGGPGHNPQAAMDAFQRFVAQKMDEEVAKREPLPDLPDAPEVPDFDPDVFLMATPRGFKAKEERDRLAGFARKNNPNPRPKQEGEMLPKPVREVQWGGSFIVDDLDGPPSLNAADFMQLEEFIIAQLVRETAWRGGEKPEPEDIPDTPEVPVFSDEVLL